MTLQVVGISTYASTVTDSGDFSVTLPSPVGGILKNDLIFLFWTCRSGSGGPTRVNAAAGLRGWNQIHTRTSSEARNRITYKVAQGGEEGASITLRGNANTGNCVTMVVVRGADIYTMPFCQAGTSASTTNPDPPSRTAPWGSAENLFLAYAGGEGPTLFSGTPQNGLAQNYQDNTLLSANVAADPVASAFAWSLINAATDDPTAWIRTSSDWASQTVVVRPAVANNHARVRSYSCHAVTAGVTRDVSVSFTGGPKTRLLFGIVGNALATSDSVTCTLDPGGANIAMSLVQDTLGTVAEDDADGDGLRWYTTVGHQALSGTYVIRTVASSWPNNSSAHFFEIENTHDNSDVVPAVSAVSDGATDLEVVGSIDAGTDGLVLALTKNGASDGYTSDVSTIGGARAGRFGESSESDVYNRKSMVYVGRASGSGQDVTIRLTGSGVLRNFVAIALGFVPTGGHNAPLVGS